MTRNDAGSDGRHRPQLTSSTVLPSATQTRKLAGWKLSVGQTISSLRLRRAARHRPKLGPIQAEPATITTSATGSRRTITVIDKAVSVARPRHNAALTDSDYLGGGGGASSSQCRDGSTSGRKSGPRHPPLTQLPPRAHNARSTPPSHPRNARKLRRYATHDYQRYESRFDGATKRYFVGIEAVQLHERK